MNQDKENVQMQRNVPQMNEPSAGGLKTQHQARDAPNPNQNISQQNQEHFNNSNDLPLNNLDQGGHHHQERKNDLADKNRNSGQQQRPQEEGLRHQINKKGIEESNPLSNPGGMSLQANSNNEWAGEGKMNELGSDMRSKNGHIGGQMGQNMDQMGQMRQSGNEIPLEHRHVESDRGMPERRDMDASNNQQINNKRISQSMDRSPIGSQQMSGWGAVEGGGMDHDKATTGQKSLDNKPPLKRTDDTEIPPKKIDQEF
jgi:hypothetical protein